MTKPGRRSAAETNIVTLTTKARPKLTAPKLLSTAERTLFNEVVRDNPHLKQSDAPILAVYVQSLGKIHKLAKANDAVSVAAWEKVTRAMLATARSLRLTTNSRTHQTTAANAHKNAAPMSYYARMQMEGDADE